LPEKKAIKEYGNAEEKLPCYCVSFNAVMVGNSPLATFNLNTTLHSRLDQSTSIQKPPTTKNATDDDDDELWMTTTTYRQQAVTWHRRRWNVSEKFSVAAWKDFHR
jgi:hypothetical protein